LEFEFDAGEAVGQFTLVNALVEKAAEVVVDGIDLLHDLVGQGLEVLLGDARRLNGAVDRHGFDIRWVDPERPGRVQGLALQQNMIATGDADIEGLANAVTRLGCWFGKKMGG
jgi:hypothetical protein